jgi:hypothetical protein
MKKRTILSRLSVWGPAVFAIIVVFMLLYNPVSGDLREPEITVNRTNLNFGAIIDNDKMTTSMTGNQTLYIGSSSGGNISWTANTDQDWIICYPKTGTGPGITTVSVAPCGKDPGKYSANVIIESNDASNSPKQIPAYLDIKTGDNNQPPFGSFESPMNGSTVSSSVPVTGWVLDDVKVDNVKIYNGSSYIGDAVLVEGARPDVEQANPDYPMNYKAGWGYMMLTNFLPNGGNGTYTLYAVAEDSLGVQTVLGSKTIYCDNESAVKPFGAIDTPGAGGTAEGNSYRNHGWVLTPQPNHISQDGSTINVWVDGVDKGHPVYNVYRSDIAQYFPDYQNSDGASGYFDLDTTSYANGVHTIYWTATDNSGNADGIGSRYFSIMNTGNDQKYKTAASPHAKMLSGEKLLRVPVDNVSPVMVSKGYVESLAPAEIFPGNEGIIQIMMKELDRVEIAFPGDDFSFEGFSGYMVVGDQLRPLPIGSTLDTVNRKFYWAAGPGFRGCYRLVFTDGETHRRDVSITILPKY